jgi:hypothetical protein
MSDTLKVKREKACLESDTINAKATKIGVLTNVVESMSRAKLNCKEGYTSFNKCNKTLETAAEKLAVLVNEL